MALIDIGNSWNAHETTDLFKRFLGACLAAAVDILAEDPGTTNHANRLLWAGEISSSEDAVVNARVREVLRYSAATNATMQADPGGLSDNDIEFLVASAIDTFATGA